MYGEASAMPGFTVDRDHTARLFDNAECCRQTETGALTGRFGCEEGVEDAAPYRIGHAGARVAYAQDHVIPRRQQSIAIRNRDGFAAYLQRAALRHRIARIDNQIDQYLFQLRRVAQDMCLER